MLIAGEWYPCDDGVERPVLRGEILAEDAGIHRNYVGMLERDECAATLDVAERLAQAIGVPLEDLIGETRRAVIRGAVVLPRHRPGRRRR